MRDFSHSLPMALLRAREAVMSEFRPMLRSHGLTEQQWRVLRAIIETESIQIKALAQRCFILMPSLSRILQSMESRGLLKRTTVRDDQRRTEVRITKKGRLLVDRVAPDTERHYRAISEKIGVDTMDSLYLLLEKVESIDK